MRQRWPLFRMGLLLAAAVACLTLQFAAQGTGYVVGDVAGSQAPADPLPVSWTLNPPFALAPTGVFTRADGRIHVTARSRNLGLDLPANYASVPNTAVSRINPFGGPEEFIEPMVTTEGPCWERGGTCDYVADAATCAVYERDHASGAIQRITGGVCQSSTPDGQARLTARYPFITALGYNPSLGLLLGTCTSSSAIYRIQPGINLVERIVGTGVSGYDLDNVPATTARIGCPRGLIEPSFVPGNPGAIDGIVFAEADNHLVRRVAFSTGLISTVAGNRNFTGTGNGDGGPATSARLFAPVCVTPGAGGVYYICESGSIRVVNVTTGIIQTQVPNLSGPFAVDADSAGNLFVGELGGARVGIYTTAGSYALAMGTPLGAQPNFSYNGERLATEVSLAAVADVAALPDDGTGLRLVIADPFDHRVRLWDEDTGQVTVFAGTGSSAGAVGDGGPATQARLWEPTGLAVAPDGAVYISERLGCRIRRVDVSGTISTVVGTGVCQSIPNANGPGPTVPVDQPTDLEYEVESLFWTELRGHIARRLDAIGNVERIAGTGVAGSSGDGGPATAAQISAPRGLAVSADGRTAYLADTGNHRVRRLDLSLPIPTIDRLAGSGTPGYGGDGAPARTALLRSPWDVTIFGDDLLISDHDNMRIRQVAAPVTTDAIISTVLGTGQRGRGRRGGPAESVRVNGPTGFFSSAQRIGFAELAPGRIATLTRSSVGGLPGSPGSLTSAVSGFDVDLDWTPPGVGAPPFSYTVYARSTPGGPVIATVPVASQTHLAVTAPAGSYVVSVQAANSVGSGPESAGITVNVPGTPASPPAPENLTASVQNQTATFSWAALTMLPSHYRLVGRAEPDGEPIGTIRFGAFEFDTADQSRPSAPVRSYTVSGLPSGAYYVTLHAENAAGVSPPSNQVTITIAAPQAPGPPTLSAAQVNGSTVTLSWSPATSGGTPSSYVVAASFSPGGPPIAVLPVGATALTVNAPAGTYYVRVAAVNAVGYSAPSNEIVVVVP